MKIGDSLIYTEDGVYVLKSTPVTELEDLIAVVFDPEKKLACSPVSEFTEIDWQTAVCQNDETKVLLDIDQFHQILNIPELEKSLLCQNLESSKLWLNHRLCGRALQTGWNSFDENIVQCAPINNTAQTFYVYHLSELGL